MLLIFAAGPPPPPPFFDRLTGTGALTGHTPDQGTGPWGGSASFYSLAGGALSLTAGRPSTIDLATLPWNPPGADYAVEWVVGASFTGTANNTMSFAVRATGAGASPTESYYLADFEFSGPATFSGTVQRCDTGLITAFTTLGWLPHYTIAANDVLRFEVSGTSPVLLAVYHNGNLLLSATDSSPNRLIAAGSAAIGSDTGGGGGTDVIRAIWAGPLGGPPIGAGPSPVVVTFSATQALGLAGALPNESFGIAALNGSVSPGTGTATTYTAPASGTTDAVVFTSADLPGHDATALIALTVSTATTFTLAGPTSGYDHNPSGPFAFQPDSAWTGTIAPAMAGLAGTWTPPLLTWVGSFAVRTAVFTPTAAGTGTAGGAALPPLTAPAGLPYTAYPQGLAVAPAAIATATTTTVTFTGVGTLWTIAAPTFTPAGVAGITTAALAVVSDTAATLAVTTAAAVGVVTWTDSTSAATATEDVTAAGIGYHVYSNTGAGDAVDYTTIIAAVAGYTWTSGPLAPGSQWTFAVRAYNTVSGLEEQNVDARVSVRINAAGLDGTAIPNGPTGLTLSPIAGGSVQVTWTYNPGGQGGAPLGFHVYGGTPAVDFAVVLASVAYTAGQRTYTATITGLVDGASYQFAVRAFNAVGEEASAAAGTVTAIATGPNAPQDLTATVVP